MTNSLSLVKCSTVFIPTITPWPLSTHVSRRVWYWAVLYTRQSLLGGAHKAYKDINVTGRWLWAKGRASLYVQY